MLLRAARPPLLLLLFVPFAPACSGEAPSNDDARAPTAPAEVAMSRGTAPQGRSSYAPQRSRAERRRASDERWYLQRAYPQGQIPEGAYARASAAWSALPRITPGAPAHTRPLGPAPPPGPPPDPTTASWDFLGPAPIRVDQGTYATPNMGPTAGRVSAIAVDPTNTDVVYAGFALGGVWKSQDGGQSWKPQMDDQPSLAVGSIAIDPVNPSTIYVGTGEPAYRAGYGGRGLFKSTDGGATWSKIGGDGFDSLTLGRLLLDGGDIYLAAAFGDAGRGESCTSVYSAAPGQGAYKSTDGGKTFTLLRAGRTVDLEVDTSVTPRRLFVSDYDAGVLRSTDGGLTWTAPKGLPTFAYGRAEVALTAADPGVAYVGQGDGAKAHVYRSIDSGATFTEIAGAPDYCYSQCDYDNSVVADPTDAGTVWLGGGLCAVFKTTTGLADAPAWTNVSLPGGDCGKAYENWSLGNVHPDVHALAFDPKDPAILYAASDGGIARTKDGGASWERLNEGIGTVQFYGLCVDGSNPEIVYGGAQDNGSFVRAAATGAWKGLLPGDGGPCAVDSGDPSTVLISGEGGTVIRATDGFKKQTPKFVFDAEDSGCTMGTDPGCGDRTGFIVPIAADPSTKGTFYVGTYRLWQASDGGTLKGWKAISDDLTGGPSSVACVGAKGGKGDDVLSAITVAPSAPGTIYTGSQGGVLSVTTDGGATWATISRAPLPQRWVSGIAVDPLDAATVYVAFSGFDEGTPSAPGHLFVSTSGGAAWSKLDIGVNAPIDALITHPVAQGLLYAGTDLGAMVSTDGGKSFAVLGDSLPNVAVYSLAFQRGSASLFAGTYGRSAWRMTFTPGALAASPSALTFTQTIGAPGPAPQVVTVNNEEILGSIVDFAVTTDAPWLSATPASGTAAGAVGAQVTIGVAPATAAGEHDASVTITPTKSGSPLIVPVHLSVKAGPTLPPTPTPIHDEGCGCSAAGSGAPRFAVALGAVALFIHRRRQRGSHR